MELDPTFQKKGLRKMIKLIKELLGLDPAKKIIKARDKKYKEAVQLQRNGNLREYGKVMKEIEELEKQYVEVMSESE
jgi:hypothetical protein